MEEDILNAESSEDIIMILMTYGTENKIGAGSLLRRFAGPIS